MFLLVSQVKMSSQERVKKEAEAARANLWEKWSLKKTLKGMKYQERKDRNI